ncbi:MAG: hypothetical protein KDD06_23315 [Phaeodactylibacter sp.]|nr:hypothetical protein [Phaeodactylibacter sp.]
MKEYKGFYTSAIFWTDLKVKALAVKNIRHLLNDHISLEAYGDGIRAFSFTPIALRPDNRLHEESIQYSSDKKELNVSLRLDFEAVSVSDEPTFLHLLAELFLRAIDEASRQKIKGFDWPRFKKDVSRLFEAEGWLQTV